jgi:hypothetical protein
MAHVHNFKDLTGMVFGRLTVNSLSHTRGQAYWLCKCSCGNNTTVVGWSLRSGVTLSCGCWRSERSRQPISHGQAGTSTHNIWKTMKARCSNPNGKNYPYYGGRGIRVCDRWQSFELFLLDMGERPPGTTLDRIDNNGNYEPGNCRWAPPLVQGNNRRGVRKFLIDGVEKTVTEWALARGVPPSVVRSRLGKGHGIEYALRPQKQIRGKEDDNRLRKQLPLSSRSRHVGLPKAAREKRSDT